MSITVRPVEPRDAAIWAELYSGYREFYRLPADRSAVERTWGWVVDGHHGMFGLVAVDDGDVPVALANLRRFARPSTATIGLYLDDLFTSPASRGGGAAAALLGRAAEIAQAEGASVVRWITAEDNAVARRLYDRYATATPWVTYDLTPGQELRAQA